MIIQYIKDHRDEDGATLLLRDAARVHDFDLNLAVTTIECRQKIATKLPTWYARDELLYPSRLSVEQCSSETTAFYKASVLENHLPHGARIADLTSGLGVDDWAFASMGYKVWYNDVNTALAETVKGNFSALGIMDQIEFNRFEVAREYSAWLEALKTFHPDAIYIDPARRSTKGVKVFRLEDCSPNILEIIPLIAPTCPKLFLKLSPMLDVTAARADLEKVGATVREVHFVGAEDECKEIFMAVTFQERSQNTSPTASDKADSECKKDPLYVVSMDGVELLSFYPSEENAAKAQYSTGTEQYLYLPGKTAMKSGAFNLLATRFGLTKAAPNTHVYFSNEIKGGFPGKIYKITKTAPFNKRTIKEISGVQGEVTTKNFPLTSSELAARLKASSNNTAHIFGLGCTKGNTLFSCTHVNAPLRIAVYAGSFNPFHKGHLAIVHKCSLTYDKELVVVSPESPFKAGNFSSGEDRLTAVKEIIDHYKKEFERRNVEVSAIEYHLPQPLYTINTLRALKHQYPTAEITFIMGADCLAQLPQWTEYKPILLEFGIAVYPRHGHDYVALRNKLLEENPAYKITLFDAEMVNISSTELRETSPNQ